MNELDDIYLKILDRGLSSLKSAAKAEDWAHCVALSEYLHNIPSLIKEGNIKRHIYHISEEKGRYLKWVHSSNDEDLLYKVGILYFDLWDKINKLLESDGRG